MAIADDFSIDRATGDIRHTSGSTNYTVIQLHRWLQDEADDASFSGNDEIDITDPTPSERSTDNIITLINGYNIDDTAAQYLYDGSIIQDGGDEIYDGILVFANAGMRLEIIQNGALATNFWTTGINADSANGISHRFLLKVRTGGADIDGRRIIGITREFGFTYSEFKINGTARGNNVLALTYATDLNNQTASGTVATWTNITNTSAGYNGIDVNNDGSDEYFYSEWNRDTRTINDLYERMKYLTRRGETTTLYGVQGQIFRGITHEITVDGGSGTWSPFEPITWSGGAGQLLARNNATATSCTKLWIQLITGVPPTDNQTITGSTSGATNLVNVTVTERTISQPFCGVSTGSALIGAYGFGVEALDLSAADKVFDLTNTQYSPPNFQTGTVAGLVIGEDYVLVAPNDGGNIEYDQFTLNGALTGAAVTAVVVNGSIPADTPNTGSIRILRANGVYTRHDYTSWTGSTFTIGSTDFSTNNAANGANCFISYIDKLATSTSETFTAVYVSNRGMFIRVRDGGGTPIKTFETTTTFGSGGFSVTASRISDV
jgi:hypothetical protein